MKPDTKEATHIIYIAENKVNGKLYVGMTSKPLPQRKACHLYDARNGSDFDFHRAIRKLGPEAFEWKEVAQIDSRDKAEELEEFLIEELDTFNGDGYNCTPGGIGVGSGEDHLYAIATDEEVIQAVVKYRTTKATLAEIADELGVTKSIIGRWNRGESRSYLIPEIKRRVEEAGGSVIKDPVSDEEAISAVVKYRTTKATQQEIADELGVTKHTISH